MTDDQKRAVEAMDSWATQRGLKTYSELLAQTDIPSNILIDLRIACPEANYPVGEARFASVPEFIRAMHAL